MESKFSITSVPKEDYNKMSLFIVYKSVIRNTKRYLITGKNIHRLVI